MLIEHFDLDVRHETQLPLFDPRYNIAPTQDVVVIRSDSAGQRAATTMRWGLVPAWSKTMASGPPMINARSETLAEKPAFRSSLRSRRCLVPADGFYEWQLTPGGGKGKKQPYYIHRPGGEPFAFAGLWELWKNPESQFAIESCTIVTTAANATLCHLHDRMPVVLPPTDYRLWLDPHVNEPEKLQHLFAPCGDDELIAEPVSAHVNRVANDDARCVEVEKLLF